MGAVISSFLHSSTFLPLIVSHLRIYYLEASSKYTLSVQHISGAGLTYAYGDAAGINFEERYTREELTSLSEQLQNVMLLVDICTQMNNIQYTV